MKIHIECIYDYGIILYIGGDFLTIGQSIQKKRKSLGMTQKELAEKVGVATITIQQYERNVREPKFEIVKRIAKALGVSQFDLLRPVMEHDEDYVNTEWFEEMTDADIFASMVPPEEMSRLVGLNSVTSGLDKENYEKLIEYAAFLRARQDASNNPDKK